MIQMLCFFEMDSRSHESTIKSHLEKNHFVRTGVVNRDMIRHSVDYGAQLLSVDFFRS